MSMLGKLVRNYLVAQSGYATMLPGGITPEVNPQGTALPYCTYQGITLDRLQILPGQVAVSTERVQLVVVASTRVGAQNAADWITAAIKASPSRQTISGVVVHQLRIEEQTDQAETFGDGGDDPARSTYLDIVGTYEEG